MRKFQKKLEKLNFKIHEIFLAPLHDRGVSTSNFSLSNHPESFNSAAIAGGIRFANLVAIPRRVFAWMENREKIIQAEISKCTSPVPPKVHVLYEKEMEAAKGRTVNLHNATSATVNNFNQVSTEMNGVIFGMMELKCTCLQIFNGPIIHDHLLAVANKRSSQLNYKLTIDPLFLTENWKRQHATAGQAYPSLLQIKDLTKNTTIHSPPRGLPGKGRPKHGQRARSFYEKSEDIQETSAVRAFIAFAVANGLSADVRGRLGEVTLNALTKSAAVHGEPASISLAPVGGGMAAALPQQPQQDHGLTLPVTMQETHLQEYDFVNNLSGLLPFQWPETDTAGK